MGSTRHIAGKHFERSEVRQRKGITEDDALETIVLKTARYGNRIRLGETPLTSSRSGVNTSRQVHGRSGELMELSLPNLNIGDDPRVTVAKISSGLRAKKPGHHPNVFQVLAVAALKFGIESQGFDDISRVMTNIYQNDRSNVSWSGAPNAIRQAITRGVLPAVEQSLYNAGGASLSSEDLVNSVPDSRATIYDVNAGLQLLELARLVKKQPEDADPHIKGTPHSMWSHKAYSNPIPTYNNPHLDVLTTLYNNGHPRTEASNMLCTEYESNGKTLGNPNATYSKTAISKALRRLVDEDLVDISTTKKGFIGARTVSLTPYVIVLMDEMIRTGHLPETLRKHLLGKRDRSSP